MLLKYVFPVPLQGAINLIPLYVRAVSAPSRDEMIDYVLSLLKVAKESGKWNDVKNYRGFLDALRSVDELPFLSEDGEVIMPVTCETAIGKSIVQTSIIKEHVLREKPLGD